MGRLGDFFSTLRASIDWVLVAALAPILGAGLITMNSFEGENYFFEKQLVLLGIGLLVFFGASALDVRFLRRTGVLVFLFLGTIATLLLLFAVGSVFKGAQSWFNLGLFAVQPSDPAKLVLVLVLAKYFSRRHIEIANFRHILISGLYAGILFGLVFIQPDFGQALIIGSIWLGMVLVSGISKKHLFLVLGVSALAAICLWFFVLEPYQQQRIKTFLHPLADIRGAGYNAYQSTIAVGSGELWGKGIGYGTQSKLQFLPEYETDFIFAAFAEEWGFAGVGALFLLYGLVVFRLVRSALYGLSNFETLFAAGLAVILLSHFLIHVGMNIGLLPVTGVTMPFMSYGGSHLITTFLGLGLLMSMRRYSRGMHREDETKEFLGI
ncbi:MAG TPA: FtsW/RodA/SpoVE family cell cycle protein [Candidatus Paceibacterota bacterium]|nr:FtsW/RodA/SpoVE family cell cycle protein [Candidatus Paceibacterota bacterium]